MESLFEKQYFEEIKEFYRPYFGSLDEVEDFIKSAFELDWDERKPRQMIFQVQRFISLANEIDKIRPARDGLRVLFLKCCMESLAARGAEALGFVASDGFAVLRNSKIATSTTPSMSEYLIKLRNKLIESGTVVSETFVKDYVFTSPSLAAAIVM